MSKKAILLLNMGGPNSIPEVKMFLENMFADKYILPMNSYLRGFIGNIIIKKRLDEAEENYRTIGGKSPLTDITLALCAKIESISQLPTRAAMRYVPPFASTALSELQSMDIEEIVLFPMYPQYSTTTTQSSIEDIEDQCLELEYSPKITTIEPYYNKPKFVDMAIESIQKALGDKNPSEYELLLSAHGLPMSIIASGDPYEKQIEVSAGVIEQMLLRNGIEFRSVRLVYQSKVGSGAWLEPNLVDVLRRPQHLKVLVYPLAFTIDNSETIFELDIEHREIAQKIGYEDYIVAKCPNDSDSFAEFIIEQIDANHK